MTDSFSQSSQMCNMQLLLNNYIPPQNSAFEKLSYLKPETANAVFIIIHSLVANSFLHL